MINLFLKRVVVRPAAGHGGRQTGGAGAFVAFEAGRHNQFIYRDDANYRIGTSAACAHESPRVVDRRKNSTRGIFREVELGGGVVCRAPHSGRGGRRFKSCHSDQSNQCLAALGFSNSRLRGQKPLAPMMRGRSDVAGPIAPDMLVLSVSDLLFSLARCCVIA